MLRAASVILICAACTRTVDRYASAAQPAFLGAASGVYEVTSNTGVPLPDGQRFFALEIRDQLLLSAPAADGAFRFVFSGSLVRDPSGKTVGVATGNISVLNSNAHNSGRDNSVPDNFSVSATVTLGLDSLQVIGHDSPVPGLACFSSSQGCGFNLSKLCDFDPEVAGIYSVSVVAVSRSAECSAHASLAGTRQWALSTLNASTDAVVLSVTANSVEFGAQLTVDLPSRTIKQSAQLPVTDDATKNGSISFAGSVSFPGEEVSLEVSDLSRTFTDGCIEHYTATGTRAQGVTFSTACPVSYSANCTNNYANCPALPFDYDNSNASFVLTATAVGTDPSQSCPSQSCVTHIQARELCDKESRRVAAGGCQTQMPTGTVVSSTGTNSNGNSCLQLRCDTSVDCGNSGGGAPRNGYTDYCGGADIAQLQVQDSCVTARCIPADPACGSHQLDCQDLNAGYQGTFAFLDQSGCTSAVCTLGAPIAPLSPAVKSAMRAGLYSISGMEDQLTPDVTIETQPTCPPVDVDHLFIACPPANTRLDTTHESCAASSASASLALALYASQANNGSVLCLAYELPTHSALTTLLMPDRNQSCAEELCCVGGSDSAPELGCAADPSTAFTPRIFIDNASSGQVTVSVSSDSRANQVSATVAAKSGGDGTLSLAMPIGVSAFPYNLSLTSTPVACAFASSPSDYDLLTPNAISLTNPGSTITINCGP